MICTPDSTARHAHASDAGRRAAKSVPSNLPMNDLRETPSTNGRLNVHILRSKWNWQFTPQLSARLILQYNALLAGTPGVGSPYTYLPTQKEFNADFLITYLVHPGTAIYVGYNSDLQNLNVQPGVGVFQTPRGYINDSRQFFVKVSYLFRF